MALLLFTNRPLSSLRLSLWLLLALLVPALPGWSQAVQVTTQHNDNLRTGANMSETVLNTSNVNVSTFGKLFSCPVDGLIFAQPLYMPALEVNGARHNVVYVATAHDSVYAFDADTGARLWQTSLGTAVPSGVINTPNIQVEVGIISTPVLDPVTGTLYVVAKTYVNTGTATSPNYVQQFWLHALDIFRGLDKLPAVQITAQSSGTGYGGDATDGNGHVLFVAAKENQRPALTLVKGTGDPILYLAFAAHEDYDPYHGWVLAYDAANLSQVAAYNDTPNSGRGGIWMSGQGLVTDANNNVYMITGNSATSTDNAPGDYGESFLKLTLSGGSLGVADFFKPNNYVSLDSEDADFGSGGAIGIPGTTLLAGEGKQGLLYVVDGTNMGQLNAGSDHVVQEFGAGGGLWGSPVFWNSSTPTLFVWGTDDVLKAFPFSRSTDRFTTTPAAAPTTTATSGGWDACGDMTVSSNGPGPNNSGIVWASVPIGTPGHDTVPGTLYAFSATPDADGNLIELWDSRQNPARDDFGSFAKYVPPTVANGKVYMATHSQQLAVYGLLPNPMLAPPTALIATATMTKITLNWTAPAGTVQSYNLYRGTKPGGETTIPYRSRLVGISYVDTQVGGGITYYYTVAAVNKAGASAQSPEASATPQTPGGPGSGPSVLNFVRFWTRSGFGYRMTGGQFQGSTDGSNWTTVATISGTPADGQWNTLGASGTTPFRYLRYLAPDGGYGNVAEVEFYHEGIKLSGTVIGTPGSWNGFGNTIANVFDGDTNTFFDAPDPGNGDWAGLDLGAGGTPPPSLVSLSPSGAAVGSPDVTVTITGSNLPSNAVAHWTSTTSGAAVTLATTFVSASQITAVIPAADLKAAGSGAITVTPGAAGSPAGPLVFTVGVPTLQVTGVTFTGGSGANIQATVTVTNKSTFPVTGLKLTAVILVAANARMAATGLPVTLTPSTLAASGTGTATITFPQTSGLSTSTLRGVQVTGTYAGGGFMGSVAPQTN